MKKIILLVSWIVLIIITTACKKEMVEIDWVDFIKFDGITYYSNGYLTDDERNNIELGEIYEIVKFKVADVVSDTKYKTKDGDTAFHDVGTKVFSVVGYDTNFRLAIDTEYGIRLYEAHRNSKASYGRDILDIKDKVEYITLNSEQDAQTVMITIENKLDVNNIVNIVLDSTIVDEVSRVSDKRYFLEFHLTDGTSVTRCYWIDDNLLVPNIKLQDNMVDIINKYLAK